MNVQKRKFTAEGAVHRRGKEKTKDQADRDKQQSHVTKNDFMRERQQNKKILFSPAFSFSSAISAVNLFFFFLLPP
ncbi:hypothetical protein [Lignipirellula cremea]|uniref:hypothetical protein n=1 Tax=Lignipirellula cremea TaxID=2528010 RepID=UPI00119FB783|nr:hypothetical protein [Lignipirellula cremea]